MARCKNCPACAKVEQCRLENKGKGQLGAKRVKKVEKANQCANPVPSNKKRRITEAENLCSAGHSGEIRGEVGPAPSASEMLSDPATRAARPTDLAEAPVSDDAAYNAYMQLVIDCRKVANASQSASVQAESESMLKNVWIIGSWGARRS